MANTPSPRDTPDDAFDLRARAELNLAFDVGAPPAELLRHTRAWRHPGLQAMAAALCLATAGGGTLLALRPPPLVIEAIEHEYYERGLHGDYLASSTLLPRLGLAADAKVPGSPQLKRLCDLDGRAAYHFTTYLDKAGLVTVFAFAEAVPLAQASGRWGQVHWQVMNSRAGQPLVLVSQQARALDAAREVLLKGSEPASSGAALNTSRRG